MLTVTVWGYSHVQPLPVLGESCATYIISPVVLYNMQMYEKASAFVFFSPHDMKCGIISAYGIHS